MQESFATYNENGQGGFILVCCHASNIFPPQFGDLGLSHEQRHDHISIDIGALETSLILADILDAPLIYSKVSRLVIDCNRDPKDFDSIPEKSAEHDIQGNLGLSEEQKLARVNFAYHPYHNKIDEITKIKTAQNPKFIAIHSFTPVYMGQKRELEIGVLIGDNSGFGDNILNYFQNHTEYHTMRDEPYNPNERVYHTLKRHAVARNLPSVMIEIRNDLLASHENRGKWAQLLANSAKE